MTLLFLFQKKKKVENLVYGGTDVFCDSKKVETRCERSTAGNTRSGRTLTESGKASDSGDYDKTQVGNSTGSETRRGYG